MHMLQDAWHPGASESVILCWVTAARSIWETYTLRVRSVDDERRVAVGINTQS